MFIKPCEGRVTSPYGMRTHPITGKPSTMHWGVDYGNTPGSNSIHAAAAGKVSFAKWTNGYGNTVMIVHTIGGRTYETVYAHLAKIDVGVGQTVTQGQWIGVKGTTGNSTGIHLHFELHLGRWNNRFTNATDPIPYLVDEEVKTSSVPVMPSAGIKELQGMLNQVGFQLGVDGILGKSTLNAIQMFQQRVGITVDGIAGKDTLTALKEVIANNAAPKKEDDTKVATYKKDAQPSKSLMEEFQRAVKAGITDGTYPQRPVTREEAAVMALRAYEKNK